jgi:predicted O-linked N-acetylglucosamine transferase (SPINDLY family)
LEHRVLRGSTRTRKRTIFYLHWGFAAMMNNSPLQPNSSEALARAFQLHKAGSLHAAEQVYRDVLESEPGNFTAWYYLGMAAFQRGDHGEAAAHLQKAISLTPHPAAAHTLLGRVWRAHGDLPRAIECYRRSIEVAPELADTHICLGVALRFQGKRDEAEHCFRRALALNPWSFEARHNLANVYQEQGRIDAAVSEYKQALALNPATAEPYYNLGVLLHAQGRMTEAAGNFHYALKLNPAHTDAHLGLGQTLRSLGQLERAMQSFDKALATLEHRKHQIPWVVDSAESHATKASVLRNLGVTLIELGEFDRGVCCLADAVRTKPNDDNAMGVLQLALGFREESRAALRKAVDAHVVASPVTVVKTLYRDREWTANRRIRLGYLSAKFRDHALVHFIEPLIAQHDVEQFELTCYYSHRCHDEFTERLRRSSGRWLGVAGLCDETLARQIVHDRIDILVDLSGCTDTGRVGVLRRRPAPLQLSYLGDPLEDADAVFDCRLTDACLDPAGTPWHHGGSSIHLAGGSFCYRPFTGAPPIGLPPALTRDHVTFGCFGEFPQINSSLLGVWAQLLAQCPTAFLLLRARSFADGKVRERAQALLGEWSIDVGRVTLLPALPRAAERLTAYADVDILLDTFPHNGSATTCEALWMGVPVISLTGDTYASRQGLSLLTSAGLSHFVARSPQEYIAIARQLAEDVATLEELRFSLRARLQASALRDEVRVTRAVEQAYRQLWQARCEDVASCAPNADLG